MEHWWNGSERVKPKCSEKRPCDKAPLSKQIRMDCLLTEFGLVHHLPNFTHVSICLT